MLTFRDIHNKMRARKLPGISDAPEFNFGMGDIDRLRGEMGELVDNLSKCYDELKSEADAKAKAEKSEKRKAASKALTDKSENPSDTSEPTPTSIGGGATDNDPNDEESDEEYEF